MFSIQRLRHFQPAWFSLNRKHTNRGSVCSLASDAVVNHGFLVPVGFDLNTKQKRNRIGKERSCHRVLPFFLLSALPYLNQLLRKWALFIFWAADGGDDPVSFLSSVTLVRAGKCEHLRLGSGARVLRRKKMNKMKEFRRHTGLPVRSPPLTSPICCGWCTFEFNDSLTNHIYHPNQGAKTKAKYLLSMLLLGHWLPMMVPMPESLAPTIVANESSSDHRGHGLEVYGETPVSSLLLYHKTSGLFSYMLHSDVSSSPG